VKIVETLFSLMAEKKLGNAKEDENADGKRAGIF
jgi:hypothetical protein